MTSPYRQLPSVDRLLTDERLRRFSDAYAPQIVVELAREQLEEARDAIAAGRAAPSYDEIVSRLVDRLASLTTPSLRRVINATGVIIHTNLGRAPLSAEAAAAMSAVSAATATWSSISTRASAATGTSTSSRCSAGSPAPRPRWR